MTFELALSGVGRWEGEGVLGWTAVVQMHLEDSVHVMDTEAVRLLSICRTSIAVEKYNCLRVVIHLLEVQGWQQRDWLLVFLTIFKGAVQ